MPSLVERWKPAGSMRAQLLLAALLWTAVGLGLCTAGAVWSLESSWSVGLLVLGLVLGWAKGVFVLDRTARRSAERISRRGDGTCLGGFFSWRTWLFVFAMMALGAFLRRSALPRSVLGLVYVAVGVALLWGSRIFWSEWARAARA